MLNVACVHVLYNSCQRVWLNFWFAVHYTLPVWVPQELSGCMLIFHKEISGRKKCAEHDIICGFNEIWSPLLTLCLKCFMGLGGCGGILIFQLLFWVIFITWSASATGIFLKFLMFQNVPVLQLHLQLKKRRWNVIVLSFNSLTASNCFARILSVYSTVVALVPKTVCL